MRRKFMQWKTDPNHKVSTSDFEQVKFIVVFENNTVTGMDFLNRASTDTVAVRINGYSPLTGD